MEVPFISKPTSNWKKATSNLGVTANDIGKHSIGELIKRVKKHAEENVRDNNLVESDAHSLVWSRELLCDSGGRGEGGLAEVSGRRAFSDLGRTGSVG